MWKYRTKTLNTRPTVRECPGASGASSRLHGGGACASLGLVGKSLRRRVGACTGTFAHGRPPQVSTPLDVLVIMIVFLRVTVCCYYAGCVRASARRGAARLLRTPVLAASYRTQVSIDSCLRVTSTRKQPLGTCVALWKTKQREHHVYNGQPLRHPLLKFLLVRFKWVDM